MTEPNRVWELDWGIACDRGTIRRENQDAALLWCPGETVRLPLPHSTDNLRGGSVTLPVLPPPEVEEAPRLFALVADGMGGPPGGAQASQIIADTAAAAIEGAETLQPAPFLLDVLGAGNDAVFTEASTLGLEGMGSTCTMILMAGERIYLNHIGDSRCYHMRPQDGSMESWSQDQNVAAELVNQGVLTPEEARNHRSSHTLTQAVGLGRALSPQEEVCDLDAPEEIFLMCSDGLLRVVDDGEVLRHVLQRSEDAGKAGIPAMRALAGEMLDLANRRGSPDNVTVLALRLIRSGD